MPIWSNRIIFVRITHDHRGEHSRDDCLPDIVKSVPKESDFTSSSEILARFPWILFTVTFLLLQAYWENWCMWQNEYAFYSINYFYTQKDGLDGVFKHWADWQDCNAGELWTLYFCYFFRVSHVIKIWSPQLKLYNRWETNQYLSRFRAIPELYHSYRVNHAAWRAVLCRFIKHPLGQYEFLLLK